MDEHKRLTSLVTIIGNAQLLQRWAMRTAHVAPGEREQILRQMTAIERAARSLQHGQGPPPTPPSAT